MTQGSFYGMLLVAVFLPVSTSLMSISYILAGFFAVISGAIWLHRQELLVHPVNVGLWLMVLMVLFGLTYSGSLADPSTWKLLKSYVWMILTPFLLVTIREDYQRRRILQAFLVVSAVILLISLVKVLVGVVGGYHADPCVFRGRIVQSFFMSFACAAWLYLAITRVQYRGWMIALFLLSSIDIFLVDGRTGYVNWVVLIAFVLIAELSWRQCLFAALGCSLMIVGVVSVSPTFLNRVDQAVTQLESHVDKNEPDHATSVGIRVEQLSIGWHLLSQRPWFGFGTGGMKKAFSTVSAETANQEFVVSENIRTDITLVNVAVQHGFIGLLLILVFVGTLWGCSCALSSEWRRLAQCFVLSYCVAGLFNPFLISSFAVHYLSMMLVVFFGGYSRNAFVDHSESAEIPVTV